MEHHKDCNWEKLTSAECEYRDTHHYCPHDGSNGTPDHRCNCKDKMCACGYHWGHTGKHNHVPQEPVRQDVTIEVKRLNIENRTPEDTAAEEKIIEAMSKRMVRVVLVHKPTNEFASFESPVSQVRIRAEQVAEKHAEKEIRIYGNFEAVKNDYVVVEYDADQVRVTSL